MSDAQHLGNFWEFPELLPLEPKPENKMDNNFIKHEVVEEMEHILKRFTESLAVLDALDRDTGSSGAYDLHDQLFTLTKSSESLAACLKRIRLIIPTE
jgi:hypothetical protein